MPNYAASSPAAEVPSASAGPAAGSPSNPPVASYIWGGAPVPQELRDFIHPPYNDDLWCKQSADSLRSNSNILAKHLLRSAGAMYSLANHAEDIAFCLSPAEQEKRRMAADREAGYISQINNLTESLSKAVENGRLSQERLDKSQSDFDARFRQLGEAAKEKEAALEARCRRLEEAAKKREVELGARCRQLQGRAEKAEANLVALEQSSSLEITRLREQSSKLKDKALKHKIAAEQNFWLWSQTNDAQFLNAVKQLKILNPSLQLVGAGPDFAVKDGQIVDPVTGSVVDASSPHLPNLSNFVVDSTPFDPSSVVLSDLED